MKSKMIEKALLSSLFVTLTGVTGNLYGQSTFGSIRGSTADQTGAALPQARIALHNLDENTSAETASDANGNFAFENLKPGHYSVTASKDGFSTSIVDQLALAARQTLRVDLNLNLAAQSQSVEVVASAASVNTENATLADSKNNGDITALPLNSRAVSTSPLAALATSPGVVKDSQGNINIGGASSAMVGFSVDGISTASARSNGALLDAYPSSEGIQEMKVTAFNNNAEFSQVGDVTFITKSGTNDFHGSLFEYLQNNELDATILNFPAKAPKRFNTFGGSLGGPVTIPKFYNGKDKTFFFFDYEGNRKRTSDPEQLLVPTAAERNGNLNGLVAAYQGGPVTNPFTGLPYANNTIPGGACQGCISSVAQAVLSYYPLPNANLNVANPSFNYQTLVPIPANTNGWDLRVDQAINSKQQVYARFSWKNLEAQQGGSGFVANQFLPNVTANDQNRSFLVSYNYSITPTSINEFRFGFTNFQENDQFPIQGSAAIAQLGLQGINISQHPAGEAFPTFTFSDGSISSVGQDRTGTTLSQTTQFTDNFSKTVGKHTLRVGIDMRRVRYNALMFFQPSDDYGDFTFSPGLFTNYAFGDFLLGLPQESFFAITSPQINAQTTQWGVYAQDEWQVNSRLTVNFGLRWELLPPFDESMGDLGSFDPRSNSVLIPDQFLKTVANDPALQPVYNSFLASFNDCELPGHNTALACSNVRTASQDGVSQGLREVYRRDFDPRISFAYRPFNDTKTVFRAGFGIFTMTTLGPMSFNNAGNPTSDLITNVNAVYNSNGTLQPPQFQFPLTAPLNQSITYGGGSLEQANDPLFRDPQAAQWNVTLEREVTSSTLARLSYVGMNSYRLPVTIDLNQIPASTTPYTIPGGAFVDPRAPYQNWFLLMSSENLGFADYQALQGELRRTLSNGLSFQANYTWAKNISDAQGSDAPTVFSGEEAYAAEIANRFDVAADRGNVVGTPRQRVLLTGIYQLPFGSGRKWLHSGFPEAVLGGWNLSTITTLQTGEWLTPTINPTGPNSYDPAQINDQSNTDVANRAGAVLRPDCVGNPNTSSPGALYNISAFSSTPPGAGRFGNCGVGVLQGPGMIDLDVGLAKQFHIGERARLRFEASFTNVLNHVNYAPPATNVSNPSTFGVLQAALPQGSGGNRVGQAALRLDF
ncbi:MAG TPA: carboxypeptidase regulatory-like domain-containing protein [Bryobacteraceae bacterium]|nr:carboxypeptidase regulatory-like domain-containing protein [Bryobacteraceae bacterium]